MARSAIFVMASSLSIIFSANNRPSVQKMLSACFHVNAPKNSYLAELQRCFWETKKIQNGLSELAESGGPNI